MGIDKPDVRFVCHYDVPDSPEAYFQEAGRAGRDGQKAYAVLLYAPSDAKRMQQIYSISFPEPAFIKETYQNLYSFLELGYGEGAGRQFDFNLSEFAKRQKQYPLTLWYALQCLEQEGYLSLTEELDNPSRIMFTVNRDELYRIQIAKPQLDTFIKVLFRTYTGLSTDLFPLTKNTWPISAGTQKPWLWNSSCNCPDSAYSHTFPARKRHRYSCMGKDSSREMCT